jgi:hypothetical protein
VPRGEIWARHTDILDHVPWPPNEHAGLLTAASTATTAVSELRQRLVRNDIHHVQHDDMADRARAFGDHLRSAVRLAQDDSYPSSFALLRVALEHQLLDTLIFRGRRYVRIFTEVSERRWRDLQAEREAGAQWAQDIVDWYWTRRGQRLTVTYRGMFSEPDENGVRTEISVYYFLRTEFDPLAPRPGNSEVGRGFPLITEEEQTQQAEQNRSLYELYLRWPRIKRNLLSNMFETEESLAQLDVHYRFLSAHVHPLADRSSDTYGRNRSWPSYDHYASELVLLYTIALAVREVRSFTAMCGMEPQVHLEGEDELTELCQQLDAVSAHLWFAGQSPQRYDLYEADNRRDFAGHLRESADNIPAVPYYSDPLRRLVALHRNAHELMTGRVYLSPWPRDDATFR